MKTLPTPKVKQLKVTAYYSGDKGTYISVMPTGETVRKLEGLREALLPYDFEGLHPALNWHTTVIYSKQNLENVADLHNFYTLESDHVFLAHVEHVEFWEGHNKKGVIVLKINCPELTRLHYQLRELGLEVSFPDYNAHITLVEDALAKHSEEELQVIVSRLNLLVTRLRGETLQLTGLKLEDVN